MHCSYCQRLGEELVPVLPKSMVLMLCAYTKKCPIEDLQPASLQQMQQVLACPSLSDYDTLAAPMLIPHVCHASESQQHACCGVPYCPPMVLLERVLYMNLLARSSHMHRLNLDSISVALRSQLLFLSIGPGHSSHDFALTLSLDTIPEDPRSKAVTAARIAAAAEASSSPAKRSRRHDDGSQTTKSMPARSDGECLWRYMQGLLQQLKPCMLTYTWFCRLWQHSRVVVQGLLTQPIRLIP